MITDNNVAAWCSNALLSRTLRACWERIPTTRISRTRRKRPIHPQVDILHASDLCHPPRRRQSKHAFLLHPRLSYSLYAKSFQGRPRFCCHVAHRLPRILHIPVYPSSEPMGEPRDVPRSIHANDSVIDYYQRCRRFDHHGSSHA